MMKKLFLCIALLLTTTSVSLSKEVEGTEAKKIVMNGEVIGMTLFDDFFKKVFEEKNAGFIYKVKYNESVLLCLYTTRCVCISSKVQYVSS